MKTGSSKELNGNRLVLRPIDLKDHRDIFLGLSDPLVIKYYGVSFRSFEETREQMNWYANLEKTDTGIWWSIRHQESDEFVGAIGFNGLIKPHKKAEIGFWLLPKNWGNGYLQEALPLVLNYAKEKLNLHRIEAFVESENINSRKALLKARFQLEGTMRDCEIKNGKFIDIDILSFLLA